MMVPTGPGRGQGRLSIGVGPGGRSKPRVVRQAGRPVEGIARDIWQDTVKAADSVAERPPGTLAGGNGSCAPSR